MRKSETIEEFTNRQNNRASRIGIATEIMTDVAHRLDWYMKSDDDGNKSMPEKGSYGYDVCEVTGDILQVIEDYIEKL